MIAAERTLLVLLAAGQSVRFGGADKLAADFLGRPLGLHVVTALEDIPFLSRVAITGRTQVDFAAHGYRIIANPAPENGLSGSVQLAATAAQNAGADAVLIALADMPRVTGEHIRRLLDAANVPTDVVASSDGATPSPPALFGAACFAALAACNGDEGARALVRAGRHMIAGPGELVDIDTPADLEALRARV
jgi:molybdenum cofactor cytidylyltransferase